MAVHLPTRRITLTVQSASLNFKRKSCSAGKKPFVEVTLGRKTRETKICQNGGFNPSWDFTVTYEYKNEPFMEFTLKEKGLKTHYMADARLDLQALVGEDTELSLPLVRFPSSNLPINVGELVITIELEGFGRAMRPAMMGSSRMMPMGSGMFNPMGSGMFNPMGSGMFNPMGSGTYNQPRQSQRSVPTDDEPSSWQVSTNAGWLNLPKNIDERLRKVHRMYEAGGIATVDLESNGFQYTFDLSKMTQENHVTKEVREIRKPQ